MTSRTIHDIKVECAQGDIANQPDVDAIVNAANAASLQTHEQILKELAE